MSAGLPATYELRQETRALAAVLGEQERHLFMVGSLLLREENEVLRAVGRCHARRQPGGLQIHVVEYEETSGSVNCVQILNHPNEVWGIACCPANPRILCTTFNTGAPPPPPEWQVASPTAHA